MTKESSKQQKLSVVRHKSDPAYKIIAVDAEGNKLYQTDSADTEEKAIRLALELNSSNQVVLPDDVARFTHRHTDE